MEHYEEKISGDKNVLSKFASKTFGSVMETFKIKSKKDKVISIRVTDDEAIKLNLLVDAGIFKNKSESASYFLFV